MSSSDQEIIEDILSGNIERFSEIIDKYKDKIFNICYSFTQDLYTSQDLTQEIFIKIFNNLKNYRFKSSFYTWIFKIASNHCKAWLSKEQRNFVHSFDSEKELLVCFKTPENEYFNNMKINQIYLELKNMDIKYRIPFWMFYYMDLSYKEIANILCIPVRTVETRIYRAKNILKKRLLELMKDE